MNSPISDFDVLQELQILQVAVTEKRQQQLIDNLTRHVRALWHHVERLETAVSCTKHEIVLKTGNSSLVMKKDGTIVIKGRDITLDASGKINVKAASTLALKGAKIQEN